MNGLFELLTHVYNLSPIPLRMAYSLWLAFIGLYIYAYHHDQFNSPPKSRKQKRQNYSNTFIFLGLFTVIIYFFAKSHEWIIHHALFDDDSLPFIGLPFMFIGLVLIGAARAALNGYWGPHIYVYDTPSDNILIRRGIYSKLRHPIYVGQVLMATGTLILSNSTVFLLFAIPLVFINIVRSKREERHLYEMFADKFTDYYDNTFWLIPGVV